MSERKPTVSIVDYGMGNLFSVKLACKREGLDASITSDPEAIRSADSVILPGVGAFEDAARTLRTTGLTDAMLATIREGRPFLGICLGQQLLMRVSFEFGEHPGMGVFDGDVVRFDGHTADGRKVKVPQVGWNRVNRRSGAWADSPFAALADGEYMYFVHSYYTRPKDPSVIAATSTYGGIEFASALRRENVLACQFHPERSGAPGLAVYRAFREMILRDTSRSEG
jgi:imidazole glycerol-phosphate synthase subunit HisH